MAIAFAFYVLLTLLCLNIPFFWDNVLLSSKFGQWYYEQGFGYLLLPPDLDCGHPPFWGYYMAAWWKIFGKTLAVSHIALLPFLLLLAVQWLRFSAYFLPQNLQFFGLLILLTEPTLLAQSAMVNTEIPLCAAYFWGLNAILRRKNAPLYVACLLMALINFRGVILCVFLFVSQLIFLYQSRTFQWRRLFGVLLPYLPAAAATIAYNAYHWQQRGWFLFNSASTSWGGHYAWNGAATILRQTVVLVWRFGDYGRIAFWILGLYFLYRFLRRRLHISSAACFLMWIFFAPMCLFALINITRSNPIIPRYFIPFFLLWALLMLHFLPQIRHTVLRTFFLIFIVVLPLSGHFWIYPPTISKAWDGHLAYIPFFDAEEKMYDYIIRQKKISPQRIGTQFPLMNTKKATHLQTDTLRYADFKEKNLQHFRYILYSNVINEFSDEELEILFNSWKAVQHFEKGSVKLTLYENPDSLLLP